MCEHARSTKGPSEEELPQALHHVRVFTQIRTLFGQLQQAIKAPLEHTPAQVAEVTSILANAKLMKEEWSQFVAFRDSKYTRNLVAHDPNFTMLLLCWKAGQRSPIHDHARSSGWVKVLDGTMRERRFNTQEGAGLVQFADGLARVGDVAYIHDNIGLHDLGATEDGPGVTLHVYSPPYYYSNIYDLDGSKRLVSMMAATAPSRDVPPTPPGFSTTPPRSPLTPLSLAAAGSRSIGELVSILDSVSRSPEEVVEAFNHTFVTAAEWRTFAHFSEVRFQRLLLFSNENYSLLMQTWLPGQATPPHDHHGSESWVRVIAGELTLTPFPEDGATPAVKETRLTAESPTFHGEADFPRHTLGNRSNSFAVSLHLYSPPYTDLNYVAPEKEGEVNGEGDGLVQTASWPTADCCTIRCGVSNIKDLVRQIETVFQTETNEVTLADAVLEVLDSFVVSEADLERYWQQRGKHGQCLKLVETPTYNIVLNLWLPGQGSVVHDHDGSACYMKVVRGMMTDLCYAVNAESRILGIARTSRVREGQTFFMTKEGVHALRNASSTKPAITLHIYSKACHSCRWFSLAIDAKPVSVKSE